MEEAGRGGWRSGSVCDGCGSAVDARLELRSLLLKRSKAKKTLLRGKASG